MGYKITSIRIIPIVLLLLLFVANLYLGLITNPDPSFIKYLMFSVIYLILGLLMISKIKFAELIGLLTALLIFFVYPAILDFKDLHPWSSGVMSTFNGLVIISCFILVLLRIRD
jgi:phosphatidylserine synthase